MSSVPVCTPPPMVLTEFVNGAFASVVIVLFGGFADAHGFSRTLLRLTTECWAVTFCVTLLFYLLDPKGT